MSSRLDRLFLLIENGTNIGVRKAAAAQLGDVAKYYPREVGPLLNRLLDLFGNKNWDTRVAAGEAVAAIVRNIPPHELSAARDEPEEQMLYEFGNFDLDSVLRSGARLYSSDEGQMIENEKHVNATSSRQEVMQQLGAGDYVGRETDQHTGSLRGIVEEKDLVLHGGGAVSVPRRSVEVLMTRLLSTEEERPTEGPPAKRCRLEGEESSLALLRRFLRLLLSRLWDPGWERRHGAATGVREVLRSAGEGVLCEARREDVGVRLLVTLALDEVSDFVSDEVVAPVREATAQALGVLALHLSAEKVLALARLLLLLSSQRAQWMVAQGGLLGIKYLLAATRDRLSSRLLPLVYPDLLQHLTQSGDEDVLAWAASTLQPVVHVLPPAELRTLVSAAWSILASLVGSQDCLLSSAAVNALMGLLSALYACQTGCRLIHGDGIKLEGCLTLLIPYLYHDVDSVRLAAVRTVAILLHEEIEGIRGQTENGGVRGRTENGGVRVQTENDGVRVQTGENDAVHDRTKENDGVRDQTGENDAVHDQTKENDAVHDRTKDNNAVHDQTKENDAVHGQTEDDAIRGQTEEAETMDGRSALQSPLLLHPVMEQLFTCALLHDSQQMFEEVEKVWLALLEGIPSDDLARACLWRIDVWLVLVMQPAHVPYSKDSYLNLPKQLMGAGQDKDAEKTSYFLGGSQVQLEGSLEEREERVLNVRLQVTRLLGKLCQRMARCGLTDLTPNGQSCPQYLLETLFLLHLNAKLGLPRLVVSLVFYHWTTVGDEAALPDCKMFLSRAEACLSESVYYEEILPSFRRMQKLCRDLMVALSEVPGVQLDAAFKPGQVLNLTRAEQLVGSVFSALPEEAREACMELWSRTNSAVLATSSMQSQIQLRVQEVLVCGLAHCGRLPDRLSPLVRPLMESLRKERVVSLQTVAAGALATLLSLVPAPGAKVVRNLTTYLGEESEVEGDVISKTLCERETSASESTQQRGGRLAFEHLGSGFGASLPSKLASLWQLLFVQPKALLGAGTADKDLGELLTSLRIMEICFTSLDSSLQDEVLSLLPKLFSALSHADPRVRYRCSSLLGVMAAVKVSAVMNAVLEQLTPRLKSSADEFTRMGVVETIFQIVKKLEMKVLPYLLLLLMACLESMTDSNVTVRFMTSHVFSSLIFYMPLEAAVEDAEGMTPELSSRRREKREFLNSLLDPHNIAKYCVPIRISAELRPYQQEGVNWLAFLNRYNLHGILCDDLGLGKTLQTICVLAGDHHERRLAEETEEFPSLVVCPSTLTGHWLFEVEKFVTNKKDLRAMLYAGSPDRRAELAKKMEKHNLVIASYEIVRNDFHVFGNKQWNYCVLDEGHIIQNHKAKLSRCIRQLRCCHRLILSGTPIQNQVLELWSLFDFLMPGFLGTEQQFLSRYHRPVAQSRDPKATPRDQELGALALEALHRKVLPFMLRRMKEDVLSDLPPKIIQDYYCDLTPLQQRLYDAHSREYGSLFNSRSVEEAMGEQKEKQQHIFQALQHLRKICNHPGLVLTNQHPLFVEAKQMAAAEKRSLGSLELSGKLIALKQLLLDCGIGASGDSVVSQHRALIFCQMRSMLDMVQELFKTHIPAATFLRLDGSVNTAQRYDIVLRFNSDPSIDCLLMTTGVGGLGLNLTAADTVIFLEHDWNPTKDLQAMDRAHRIGQKRVVNVYRILTRDTLEEKIMGLQKFKLSIANTVVSTENSSISSMGTNHLLDLFEESPNTSSETKKQRKSTLKAFLEKMDTMEHDSQYEREFSMAEFEKKLD